MQANATRTVSNSVAVGGDFAIGGASALTLSGTVDLGAATSTLTVSNTAATTLSGIISNGGLSINNTGASTLTLSGANTYADGTTLTAGTLIAGSNSAFGTGTLTINGGTLQSNATRYHLGNSVVVGSNFTIGGASTLTFSGTVDLGAATRTLTDSNTAATTLSGIISNGGLINAGAGSLTLSGNNTYTRYDPHRRHPDRRQQHRLGHRHPDH